jgi:biotin synthase
MFQFDVLALHWHHLLSVLYQPNDIFVFAYIRKHYYGKRVKLNMILNAKSGICPEDCGYCGQSREIKQKQRYRLVMLSNVIRFM